MVKGNDFIRLRKLWHLLPPAEMAATAAMRQDKRRAFTVDFIIQLNTVDVCKRHAMLLF
jgi:hypothetical protein